MSALSANRLKNKANELCPVLICVYKPGSAATQVKCHLKDCNKIKRGTKKVTEFEPNALKFELTFIYMQCMVIFSHPVVTGQASNVILRCPYVNVRGRGKLNSFKRLLKI